MKTILSISIAILISSCATMTPKECKNANWKDIGYKDGSQGEPVRLSKHTNACKKINIKPNKKRYMSGYRKGEKIYCTYDNGFKNGRSSGFGGFNGSFDSVCLSASLRGNFYRGYKDGLFGFSRGS